VLGPERALSPTPRAQPWPATAIRGRTPTPLKTGLNAAGTSVPALVVAATVPYSKQRAVARQGLPGIMAMGVMDAELMCTVTSPQPAISRLCTLRGGPRTGMAFFCTQAPPCLATHVIPLRTQRGHHNSRGAHHSHTQCESVRAQLPRLERTEKPMQAV
jgi:hypothetical protein